MCMYADTFHADTNSHYRLEYQKKFDSVAITYQLRTEEYNVLSLTFFNPALTYFLIDFCYITERCLIFCQLSLTTVSKDS